MAETSGSNDETIIKQPNPALLEQSAGREDESLRQSARRRVALVAESGTQMSGETRALLRNRLRILACVFFGGFGAFLLWRLFKGPGVTETGTGVSLTFYAHLGVTILMGLVSWKLCAKCDLSLPKLRIAELLIVGGSATFFFILGIERLRFNAVVPTGHTHVPNIIGAWQFLIFSYALFIPNTWRRAAVIIGILAVAPLVEIAVVALQLPAFSRADAVEGVSGCFC